PVTLQGSNISVAPGIVHTCALTSAGQVKCWGNNGSGQLGVGTTINATVPPASGVSLAASSSTTATALVSGAFHTCAILNDGSVKCWGENTQGQLGIGN